MAAQWPPKYIAVWLVSMGARLKIYSILVGKWERYNGIWLARGAMPINDPFHLQSTAIGYVFVLLPVGTAY